MLKRYIIFFCFLTISVSAYGQTADIDMQTLVDICKAYENAIVDVNIEYEFEVVNPLPIEGQSENVKKTIGPQKGHLTAKRPFEQSYKNTMVLLLDDGKGNGEQFHVTRTYNGNIYKEYQKIPEGISFGDVSNKYIPLTRDITPLTFTIFHFVYNREPLLDVLQGRYSDYTLSLDPNISKVSDFNTVEVSCFSQRKKFKALSFFFSVDHNYTLTKILRYRGPQRLSTSYNAVKLKYLGGGIWFPVKSTINDENDVVENVFTTSKVAINQGFGNEDFDIKFPPGTTVHDQITGKHYRIKPTQEQVDESMPK